MSESNKVILLVEDNPDDVELTLRAFGRSRLMNPISVVRDGIEGLSERCQAMVRMLFFETPARPYKDVAQALGIATGSIGFMRMKCLDRLRSVLERVGL